MSGTTTAVRGHGAAEVRAGRALRGEPVMLGDVLPDVLRALAVAEDSPRAREGRAALSGPPGA